METLPEIKKAAERRRQKRLRLGRHKLREGCSRERSGLSAGLRSPLAGKAEDPEGKEMASVEHSRFYIVAKPKCGFGCEEPEQDPGLDVPGFWPLEGGLRSCSVRASVVESCGVAQDEKRKKSRDLHFAQLHLQCPSRDPRVQAWHPRPLRREPRRILQNLLQLHVGRGKQPGFSSRLRRLEEEARTLSRFCRPPEASVEMRVDGFQGTTAKREQDVQTEARGLVNTVPDSPSPGLASHSSCDRRHSVATSYRRQELRVKSRLAHVNEHRTKEMIHKLLMKYTHQNPATRLLDSFKGKGSTLPELARDQNYLAKLKSFTSSEGKYVETAQESRQPTHAITVIISNSNTAPFNDI